MSGDSPEGNRELSYNAVEKLLENSDWPLTTTEVARVFDITQQSAHYRLTQLHKRGDIEKKKSGGSAYWRPSS
ncbi:FaeA/PapI family transcriptional regulator [Haloarcula amylovorans]|uniref:FaeA/PapI family transcriptional regulator n=1 Tax=Haloarcula amylovorans TaxID=2562280 RepID=UPI0037427312